MNQHPSFRQDRSNGPDFRTTRSRPRRDRGSERGELRDPHPRVDHRLYRSAVAERHRARDRAVELAELPQSACILVADDEPALLGLLTTALRRRGFTVVEARSGRELWAKARAAIEGNGRQAPIDLIVADGELTDLSTLDVLAAIRRLDGALPVVLTTALDAEAMRADAQALGADGVLGKPFVVDDLIAQVIELCS